MQSTKYTTLFACLIFAMLVSTALSSLSGRTCVDGKEYFNGCTMCKCAGGQEICLRAVAGCSSGSRKEAPADFWKPSDVVEPPRA